MNELNLISVMYLQWGVQRGCPWTFILLPLFKQGKMVVENGDLAFISFASNSQILDPQQNVLH